jgi:hypothetical protein
MNIYYPLDKIQTNKIIFHQPIPNKFSNYTQFYKIIYNTKLFTLNSILLYFDISYSLITIDNERHKISLNYNDEFLLKIKIFEEEMLNRLNIHLNKNIIHSLYNTLLHNNIIYINELNSNKIRIYIRISGIWETVSHVGLTIKSSINSKTI